MLKVRGQGDFWNVYFMSLNGTMGIWFYMYHHFKWELLRLPTLIEVNEAFYLIFERRRKLNMVSKGFNEVSFCLLFVSTFAS